MSGCEGSWAGAVEPQSPEDWQRLVRRLSRGARCGSRDIAAEEGADALAIGTELEKTTQRPEWRDVDRRGARGVSRPLTYAAHNVEEAETVPFWARLDADRRDALSAARRRRRPRRRGAPRCSATAERLDALAARTGKPIVVAEIGLRSAAGAAAKPWESAEERAAEPDPQLAGRGARRLARRCSTARRCAACWSGAGSPIRPPAARPTPTSPCRASRPSAYCSAHAARRTATNSRTGTTRRAGARSPAARCGREGGEAAALQRPLRREVVDHAELELVIVVARETARCRRLPRPR